MKEKGAQKDPRRERPALPNARAILDAFDAQMLPTVFDAATPRLGQSRPTGEELHAKYESLSREKVSELVAVEVFRAEAADGQKGNIQDNDVLVRVKPDGEITVTGSYLPTADGERQVLVYRKSPDASEHIVVQEDIGGGRNLSVDLKEGQYSIDSEHWGEVPVILHGTFDDAKDGTITRAAIQTNIFEKKNR